MDLVQSQLEINRATARILRWGFLLSAAMLVIGLIVTAIRGESLYTSLEGLPSLFDDLIHGHGPAIVGFGILVMVAAPIAATIGTMVAFIQLGDRRYALITAAVLVILLISAVSAALR
jgi:uncharacterized membrane protein